MYCPRCIYSALLGIISDAKDANTVNHLNGFTCAYHLAIPFELRVWHLESCERGCSILTSAVLCFPLHVQMRLALLPL